MMTQTFVATFPSLQKKFSSILVAAIFCLSAVKSLACTASFTETVSGNIVQFTNTSVASATATYHWNFDDGTVSDSVNPVHNYIYPSSYYCCLSVTDTANACYDVYCDSVVLPSSCISNFTWSLTGYTYYFTDNSFGNPTHWHWNFGDGTTSSAMNPSHAFQSIGSFWVCLTINDSANACFSSSCQLIYVPIDSSQQCQACFTKSSSNDSVLFFDCSLSLNQITQWNWEFGDGSTSTMQDPVHSYSALGIYDVCLTTTDDSGCISTFCDTVMLINSDCSAAFIDSSGGTSVYFFDQSNAGTHLSSWTFGDGTSSSQANPVHTYSSAGTYTVCLTIDDSAFCHASSCQQISVGGGGVLCNAYFVLHPDSFQQGLYWGFNLASGSDLEYFWSWGDGTTSTGTYPSHQYSDSSAYYICMGILDTVSGCTDSFCADYLIQKLAKPMNIHEVIFVNIATVTPTLNTIPDLHLFPNPASRTIRVESNGKAIDEIRITDVSGEVVKRITDYKGELISIEALPKGVFIIQSLVEGIWRTKLLIRQ